MWEEKYDQQTGIINSTCSSSGQTYGGPYIPHFVLPSLKW